MVLPGGLWTNPRLLLEAVTSLRPSLIQTKNTHMPELKECLRRSATGNPFCRVREQRINWPAFFIHPPNLHHIPDIIAGRTTTADAPVTEATFVHRVGHMLPFSRWLLPLKRAAALQAGRLYFNAN